MDRSTNVKTKSKKNLIIISIVLLVLIIGLLSYYFSSNSRPKNIDDFFNQFHISDISMRPEYVSAYLNAEDYGLEPQDTKLDDISPESLTNLYNMYRNSLQTLQSYDKSTLTSEQLLNYEILEWYLLHELEGEQFAYHKYLLEPLWGLHNDFIGYMTEYHTISNEVDAENYIQRISQVDTKFDQLIERLKISEEKGIIPSKLTLAKVKNQIIDYSYKLEKNPLYNDFRNKVDNIDISNEKKEELCKLLDQELIDTVIPAYEKLNNYVKELEKKATIVAGVWELPNGEEYYQYMLKHNTTTNYTPQEIHDIGLSEVERIQAEINEFFNELGTTGNTLGQKYSRLKSPKYTGESALLKYKEYIDEMEEFLPTIFNILPQSKVKIEPVPEYSEAGGLNYYSSPSKDGSKQGTFYLNLRQSHVESGIKSLAYHEAVPGHHLQKSIEIQEIDVPDFRNLLRFESYLEGWALYAEKLAGEYGFYDTPESKLGSLQSELYRAVRLVVDTGIHYKGWSREEAINYYGENTGFSGVNEVDRMIVWPGQACAYKIGELEILKLRERVKTELDDKFDIKEFHDVILKNGTMPLVILEKQVENYILDKK